MDFEKSGILNLVNINLFYFSIKEEMFYLTMYSAHFIYGYMVSDMAKDYSDS